MRFFNGKNSDSFWSLSLAMPNEFGSKILTGMFCLILAACSGDDTLTQADLDGDVTLGGFSGLSSTQTISSTKVQLTWDPASPSLIQRYNIYNATLSSQPVLIKTVDNTASQTTISGLNPGFMYKFRVRAVKAGSTDENLQEDVNTRDLVGIPYGGAVNATVISSTSVRIDYNEASAGEALEARVYCQNSSDPNWQLLQTISNMSLSSVQIDNLQTNTSYTCRVNLVIDGQEDNNLSYVNFTALGAADRLLFSVQPGNGQTDVPLTQQPIVHILDENDNIVSGGPDATALITLEVSVTSPTSGTVRGTFAINAVGGIASFTDIFMQESGVKVISARKEDTSAQSFGTPVMTVDSSNFNISPGNISAANSSIAIEPASPVLVANGSDAYVVRITLRDTFGNPVEGTRPEFASNIIGDFLTQPLNSTDSSGETTGAIATTIADLPSNLRMLNVSSPAGLESVQVAAPFVAGPANQYAFSVQPSNSPAGNDSMNEVRVVVQDIQGNIISSGSGSNSSVTLSIANNVGGAILSGTNPVTAVNGEAIFSDLGIDLTGNGYQLIASGGVLDPATSNNFNITSGLPRVISMIGPTEALSGNCSDAITLQLQDFGGNPAKAVQNTTVQLSGLGNGSFYSSSTCGGSPLSNNVTFTPGTDTRTLYFQSNKVESLTIAGTDSSAVLTPSSYSILVTPNKMRLTADDPPPALPGSGLNVTAGLCSTVISIAPLAEDGSAGQFFNPTTITLTGVLGSQARIYSDSSCSTELDPANLVLEANAPPNVDTEIYLSDPRGETLLVNVSDPTGDIGTVSLPQTVTVTASDIDFTGPSEVVSGQCSQVFTITLEDTQGNNVNAHQQIDLNVLGLESSATGQFFTSPSCSGSGSNSTVIVPQGSAIATVYFRGFASEILSISLSDGSGPMNDSPSVTLSVTPSSFRIVAPNPAESMTSECAGPLQIQTLDGQGSVSPVASPVQADLSGGGDSGLFFSDNSCGTEISSVTFSISESSKDVYFKGQYPETNLTLVASDNAGTLLSDTQNWVVLADWSWIGTASTQTDSGGDLLPFRIGYRPVAGRYDGAYGMQQITFSPDKKHLFVTDYTRHKILKYDYDTNSYIGWMGRVYKENGIGATGSNLVTPSPALCVATNNYDPLPGWCTGGRSVNGDETIGGFYYPWGIHADDTYVYTTSYHGHFISRHRADTGAFEGWIGFVNNSTPTGPATGGPATCSSTPNNSVTPGWCIGGNRRYHNSSYDGDGRMRHPESIETDNLYVYVGHQGSVLRFDKGTGSFQGWIGMVDQTPTGGAVGCTLTGSDVVTPGWCTGGRYKLVDPRGNGGVHVASDLIIEGTNLYVLNYAYGGVINRYDKDTGAFIETLPNLNFSWVNPRQFAWFHKSGDPEGKFYVADDERIIKVSQTGVVESWMGKVANNAGMSGNVGCNTLQPNDNTPGWCLGGTHKPGLDETSFLNNWGIAHDGTGSLITASRDMPMIKKFSSDTGNYEGSIGFESISPPRWTGDRTLRAEAYGVDDNSGYNPQGVEVVGDFMFVADYTGSRIKKINLKTGEVLGWVGGITSRPTGGETAGCTSANAMGPSPGWCLGSNPYPNYTWNDINMIDDLTDGIVYRPYDLASDGTWLYVTDYGIHRVQRFNIATGAYGGWIGRINRSPTGGDPGCNGAPADTFTPGWCLGGMSENGTGDGQLRNPTGIEYVGGNLYVIDAYNHRVVSYQAATGAFNGWIGRINANPSSGCTVGSNGNYNVAQSGWCIGGTSRRANYRNDRGGGFNFDQGYRSGIFSDGTFLYVTNTRNIRIDKINLNGEFIEAVRTRDDQYINSWQSAEADVANVGNGINCSYPTSVWGDSQYLYGANAYSCSRDGDSIVVWKMDKSTGNIIGWKGGVSATYPPTGGEPGCAGASIFTPGWCQGGRVAVGNVLGQFSGVDGMITGDQHFIYAVDRSANRVIRIPK